MFSEPLGERAVLEDFLDSICPNDVVYDVGVNLGKYACLAASRGAEVVAFEPTDIVADRLEANAELNGRGVTVYRLGLADESTETEMRVNMNWTLEPVSIEMVPGDEFREREGLPIPAVVKIDVEGGELATIRGLGRTLRDPECRLVYCEVHIERLEKQGIDVDDIRATLDSYGFDIECINERGEQRHLRAEKRSN